MGDNTFVDIERINTLEIEVQKMQCEIDRLRSELAKRDVRTTKRTNDNIPKTFVMWCVVAALLIAPVAAFPADKAPTRKDGDRTTSRDSNGRVVGTSTTSGDKTTYRGYGGRVVYTSTERNGTTQYRDYYGRSTGATVTTNNTTAAKTSSINNITRTNNSNRSGK